VFSSGTVYRSTSDVNSAGKLFIIHNILN